MVAYLYIVLNNNLKIMTELANVFTPSTSNVFFMFGLSGIIGFAAGFLLKSAVLIKHKKRAIYLEDEMLANHSRILNLEKQVTELKEERAKLNGGSIVPKVELKVS
jgi:uncharacterized membrane protein (Fun14 family)